MFWTKRQQFLSFDIKWQPIVSVSPRGIDFMVRHGIKGVVPSGGRVDEIAAKWQQAQAAAGRQTQLGEGLALVLQVHMADNQSSWLLAQDGTYRCILPENKKPVRSQHVLYRQAVKAVEDAGKNRRTRFAPHRARNNGS